MKNKKNIIIISSVILIGIIGVIVRHSVSSYAFLENDARVKPNSELIYYIDVIYDGKDADVITSNDSTVASVYSDYIYVEDKLPEGLTFKRFITAEDGTIGAMKRDGSSSCAGHVVGDSEGLNYNAETNTVSFKVKSLQAGCKLTVGVVTQTPELGDKKRMDFYNVASGRENDFSTLSNMVHVFMGKEEAERYSVEYIYDGEIPENAPELPEVMDYTAGSSVGVSSNISLAGYTFSGWTTTDVEVANNSFTMPAKKVTFKGHFTENPKYKVTYQIEGEAPEGFIVPDEKRYARDADVVIDSLMAGEVVNNYKFLGWTINKNIDISDDIFVMPPEDVILTGSFEKVTHKVTYQYQGNTLPNNYEQYLPAVSTYSPGDVVEVDDNNPELEGYEFLGWYSEDSFIMPDEDVTIYGEWRKQNGTFAPKIQAKIIDQQEYYTDSNDVAVEVKVENNNSFPINDVIITNNVKNINVKANSQYNVKAPDHVVIQEIEPNSSITINATIPTGKEEMEVYDYNFELVGAISDDDYTLDETKDYKSSIQYRVINIKLVVEAKDGKEKLTNVKYGLYSDEKCTNLISEGTDFNIEPLKTYYLKEIETPNGYQPLKEPIKLIVDENGKITNTEYESGINTLTIQYAKIEETKKETEVDKPGGIFNGLLNNPKTTSQEEKKKATSVLIISIISVFTTLLIRKTLKNKNKKKS